MDDKFFNKDNDLPIKRLKEAKKIVNNIIYQQFPDKKRTNDLFIGLRSDKVVIINVSYLCEIVNIVEIEKNKMKGWKMKIHYTIYDANYDRGEDTRPICNDNTRFYWHHLTRDVNEVTCKKCMKSLIASRKFALEMHSHRNLFNADHVDRMHKDIKILENKLKG